MYGTALIVRLIGHMTRERSMVSEHGILHQRLTRTNGFKKLPHVRPEVVVIVPFKAGGFRRRLLPGLGIVIRMPLLEVCVLQTRGQSVAVVAGRKVNTWLWNVGQAEFGQLN